MFYLVLLDNWYVGTIYTRYLDFLNIFLKTLLELTCIKQTNIRFWNFVLKSQILNKNSQFWMKILKFGMKILIFWIKIPKF